MNTLTRVIVNVTLTCQIVDVETGRTLAAGQEGEIWVRGPQLCKGYLGLPEQTANLFTEDGWVKTGAYSLNDINLLMTSTAICDHTNVHVV